MVISLYTSRVVIQTLGVSDYGVFGVIAGVVTMFSFLNGTMAGTTARFLSYELGTGNRQRLKDTFSTALFLHVVLALFVAFLCETIGMWFFEYKLVIPDDRIEAGKWVLHLSVLSMFLGVIRLPFNAAIISHERMDFYAYVEIGNSVLRLLILYVLMIGSFDKLILYAILLCSVSLTITCIYIFYCTSKFEDCSLRLKYNKVLLKPMMAYSGWDFYGSMSLMAITQGINMLLNMWFGTVMNAAYDIATRVKGIIMNLSTNVTTAIRPQIYKAYSAKELDRMFSLMQNGSRITFILMMFFCAPLIVESHYIIQLWLGVVPDYSVVLLQLSLLWNIVVSMSLTMGDVVHATGVVKFQNIVAGTMYLLIFPITYISFRLGAPYWIPFVLNVIAVMTAPLYSGHSIKKQIPSFSWRKHVFPDMMRNYATLILILTVLFVLSSQLDESFLRLVITTIVSTVLVGLLGYYIVLPSYMREKVLFYIKTKLFRNDYK